MEPQQAAAAAAANGSVHLIDKCGNYQNFIAKSFCQGGSNMYIISAIGLLVVFLIFERLFAIQRMSVDKTNVTENLFTMILRGDIRQAIAFCDSRPTPLTNTLKAGLVQTMNRRPDEEIQVAMDASVLRETPKVEGWVSFLAVFGNVSVLVGLMGTIIGLITSFGGVAEADAATKAARLSMGISEALNNTAFGLIVAIISVIAFGYLQVRIGRLISDMQETSMTLMNLVCANREKIKD